MEQAYQFHSTLSFLSHRWSLMRRSYSFSNFPLKTSQRSAVLSFLLERWLCDCSPGCFGSCWGSLGMLLFQLALIVFHHNVLNEESKAANIHGTWKNSSNHSYRVIKHDLPLVNIFYRVRLLQLIYIINRSRTQVTAGPGERDNHRP